MSTRARASFSLCVTSSSARERAPIDASRMPSSWVAVQANRLSSVDSLTCVAQLLTPGIPPALLRAIFSTTSNRITAVAVGRGLPHDRMPYREQP